MGGIVVSLLSEGPTGAQPTKVNLDQWINGQKLPFTTVLVPEDNDPHFLANYGAKKDNFLIFDLKTMELLGFHTLTSSARGQFEELLGMP